MLLFFYSHYSFKHTWSGYQLTKALAALSHPSLARHKAGGPLPRETANLEWTETLDSSEVFTRPLIRKKLHERLFFGEMVGMNFDYRYKNNYILLLLRNKMKFCVVKKRCPEELSRSSYLSFFKVRYVTEKRRVSLSKQAIKGTISKHAVLDFSWPIRRNIRARAWR